MLRSIIFLCLMLPVSVLAQDTPTSSSVEVVPFASPEGVRRLASSYAVDFYSLANQYEPQMNLGTCGPTSAVIVLNALRSPDDERRPVDKSAFPADFRANLPRGMEPVKPRYTQRAFFDGRFENVKAKATFYGGVRPDGKRDPGTFLILDTNPNRAPWVWVPASALFESMKSFDTVENRGFLLVSEGDAPQG